MTNNYSHLVIHPEHTISQALKKIDANGKKLLIVLNQNTNKFVGLISIGDLQRAIVANYSLSEPVNKFIREDLIVASTDDSAEKIKNLMLKHRLVFMPVINFDNYIEEVIYWDDIIFEDHKKLVQPQLNLPVVIMAGGFGSRLKPLTNVIPKPLIPIGESTILENIIAKFKEYNCIDFFVSVNYKADLIKYYFDAIDDKTYNINFFVEEKPLGTAGSLSLLKGKLKSTFFLSNCDILIDDDYASFYEYHKEHRNDLSLIASIKQFNIPYGTLKSGKNGELLLLEEKPELSFMINCGMYLIEPSLINDIPDNTFFHITDLIEKARKDNKNVGVFPISEKSWTDIGEWPQYKKLINI